MKLAFDIVEYQLGPRAGLYTIRLHEPADAQTELDHFLNHHANTANKDFERLVNYLSKCPVQGFREGRKPEKARFRDEDDILALSVAHPDPKQRHPPSLRLFCLRYQNVVILGGGGIKRDRTLLEFRKVDSEADRACRIVKGVGKRFQARLDLGEIRIVNTRIEDNLSFHKDDIP